MKVILRTDVPKIGKKHDVKNVSDGYAVNYLLPRGLAERATDKSVKRIEIDQKANEAEREVQHELLEKNMKSLQDVTVVLSEKVNEKGHLYEGIHASEILKALKDQAHVDLAEEHIVLKQPIKEVGEHTVVVKVGESKGSFTLNITAI